MSTRRTGQFRARGSDGLEYTINIYTKFVSARSPGKPAAEVPGASVLRTSGGDNVECVSKGQYTIAGKGITLTSDEPDAPVKVRLNSLGVNQLFHHRQDRGRCSEPAVLEFYSQWE